MRAGLRERAPVPQPPLDALRRHRGLCREPTCALGTVPSSADLWSVVEAAQPAELLETHWDVEREVRSRWTQRHDRRLDPILDLLDETLPSDPELRAIVREARVELDLGPELRLELAAILLEQAIEAVDGLVAAA